MTVKELIEMLSEFDPDAEVVIGMIQRYGSDFAMEITNISYENVDNWTIGPSPCVVITEGAQIGSVCYEDDDEYDY